MTSAQAHASVFAIEIGKAMDRIQALQAVGRPHLLSPEAADRFVQALRVAAANLSEARELIEAATKDTALPHQVTAPTATTDEDDPFA